jgi:FlaA1/EpsC-like NDP-sugar epimerase
MANRYRQYKHYLVLLADIFIVISAFLFSIFVVDLFKYYPEHYTQMAFELPFVITMYFISFELLGMYKSLWKYASVEELIKGALSNFAAINAAYIVLLIFNLHHFNYAIYFVAFFLATTGTVGMRLSYRAYRFFVQYRADTEHKKRTIIVGAGNAGVMLADEIHHNEEFDKKIIAFVDDNKDKFGLSIRGVPILGPIKNIKDICLEKEIEVVILAIPSLNYQETKEMLNLLEETNCQIKLMPPFYEMVGTTENLLKVRDVNIEDLLGREPITLDNTGIESLIQEKTVMVTGGGGSIGSELVRQLRQFCPDKIVIVDIYENNAYDLQMELQALYRDPDTVCKPDIIVLIASVRDEIRMNEIFETYKPSVVFHAAAHKHVPLMEVSPREAVKNNVLGTYNMATLADKHSVEKFVLVSTDKAVRPTNVMGATKRIAEKIIFSINQDSKTDFAAVRFGNVLGSNGSVIPLFKKQIAQGGPVTVTHPEITRFFMTIPEACQLVIQAAAFAKGGELFVLDMGKPVKIIDLAEKMIRLSGKEPHKDIPIKFTGLRPGEKMYEELLKDSDTIVKTSNKKIFIEQNNNGYKQTIKNVLEFKQNKDTIDITSFIKANVRSYEGK